MSETSRVRSSWTLTVALFRWTTSRPKRGNYPVVWYPLVQLSEICTQQNKKISDYLVKKNKHKAHVAKTQSC